MTSSNIIISRKEQILMLCWIFFNLKKFKKNSEGPYRNYLNIDNIKVPRIFWKVRRRIELREKLSDYKSERNLGNLISVIGDSGYIHPHTDTSEDGYKHIRYNLFLSLPFVGGLPIYDMNTIEVKEREYLKCDVSKVHMCQKVKYFKPRVIVSYGFLVND